MELPRMFLGTERLAGVLGVGAAVDRKQALGVLDRAAGFGDVGLDLAASYQLGNSERLVGDWLKGRKRDEVFLATKIGHPLPWSQHRLGRKSLEGELRGCLKRLRTHYVDLLLLHRDDPAADLGELAETLSSFQRAGTIRRFGVSNWSAERVAALDQLSTRCHGMGVFASSPQFSLAYWSTPLWPGCVSLGGPEGQSARAYYRETQLPVIAYSSLGRGLVGGKGKVPTAFDHPENQRRRERAGRLARDLGWTTADVAIAYLRSQPFPVSPVISTYDLGHLESNHRALDLRLTAEQIAFLESGFRRDEPERARPS